MQLSKRRMTLIICALVAIGVLIGAGAATIFQTRSISSSITVPGEFGMQVYIDSQCRPQDEWTTQVWGTGTLARGASIESGNRWVMNTAADPMWTKWSATVPAGFTLTCKYNLQSAQLPTTAWAQNVYLGPLANNGKIIFFFTLTATSSAPAGVSNIDITFSGSDSAT